jgi:serine protease Do
LRALTVLVRMTPPPVLEAKYRQLALRYALLRPLFMAEASEAFGSGFVMVRRLPQPMPLVVTNLHVVGLASRVSVALGTDGTPVTAEVVFVDNRYDLAVLRPIDGGEQWARLSGGLAFANAAPRDQDEVVASGYPGIGAHPSYQVTRGFVSNEHFLLNDDASELLFVQHTAPIDPGSSGGPLTTPEGKLLGVNTLKVRGRENVGLAVPAGAVEQALSEAIRNAGEGESDASAQPALAACETLLAALSGGDAALTELERSLGAGLVAEHGPASLAALPTTEDDEWPRRFLEDPTGVLLRALALRLQRSVAKGATSSSCAPVASDGPGGSTTFQVRLAGSERQLGFAREQGRWKLATGALGAAQGRSFLDQLDARRAPAKRWKPSLR